MIHVVLDVGGRYIFNAPLPATIEIVSNWWMIMIVFPVLALTQRQNQHIEISALTDLMPARHRLYSMILGQALTIVVVAMLAWYGFWHALKQMGRNEHTLGVINVQVWPMRFVLVAGLTLFAVQLLLDMARTIRTLKDTKEDGE